MPGNDELALAALRAAGVWKLEAGRGEIENLVRRTLEQWEAQRQPSEWDREQEARLVALEEKVELRLSQFEKWLMMNRGNNP